MTCKARLQSWKTALTARAKKLGRDIPALRFALKDPQTPWFAKALAVLTVAYALSPVDLIPDFVPVLGYLDDLLLLPMLVWLTIRCLPQDVLERARSQATAINAADRSKKWYYAVPIVLIWILLLLWILKAIFF